MIMNREQEIRTITLWGAAVNIILTVLKVIAGIMGRSAAMIADGVHSLSDLIGDAVILVFTHISAKGMDRSHSFGHGKFETLASLIVSILLLIVGATLVNQGLALVVRAFHGEVLPRPGFIALIAAVVSIIAKELLYRATVKVGRRIDSSVVIANAWHHRTDALSSVASLLGIGGAIILGRQWTILDPLASCLIGIYIIVIAVKLAAPNLSELLEASLPDIVQQEIIAIASAVPGVNNLHDLKTRRSGSAYIIDAHIFVNPDITIVEAHNISTNVEEAIRSRFGQDTQINIHIEPDTDTSQHHDHTTS